MKEIRDCVEGFGTHFPNEDSCLNIIDYVCVAYMLNWNNVDVSLLYIDIFYTILDNIIKMSRNSVQNDNGMILHGQVF